MNRYNYDTEDENADIPWDWTQDLADQYTDEFYAAKDEWQRKKKEVDAIKKIKEEFEDEEEKANQELVQEAEQARENQGQLVETMIDARIAFEEARLNPDYDPNELEPLRSAFYEAEGAFWENTHLIQSVA